MPTRLNITIIFNCVALALLASASGSGAGSEPVNATNPAIVALSAPSPATPVIDMVHTAPDVMQLLRQHAERDRMAASWVTLNDGPVRPRGRA